jgi:hypothetical protein
MLCSMVGVHWHFRGTCCLHFHASSAQKVETVCSCKTSVFFCQMTWCYNLEDHTLYSHHCENTSSKLITLIYDIISWLSLIKYEWNCYYPNHTMKHHICVPIYSFLVCWNFVLCFMVQTSFMKQYYCCGSLGDGLHCQAFVHLTYDQNIKTQSFHPVVRLGNHSANAEGWHHQVTRYFPNDNTSIKVDVTVLAMHFSSVQQCSKSSWI